MTESSNEEIILARPTLRIGGQDNERARSLIIAMEMREREGGMSALEIRFSNVASLRDGGAELAFEDGGTLRHGARIQVYSGDVNAPRQIFDGLVTGLEAEFTRDNPPELVVLAEDALARARMKRKTRVHENVTLRRLAEQLAQSLGLRPVITGLTDDIGTHVQLSESDLAFVRRLLRLYDSDLSVVGEELHVSPRSDVSRGELVLAHQQQLISASVMADLAHQRTELTVAGWDADRGERVTYTSRGGNLAPGNGRTGASILQEALGARSEHIGHVPVTTSAEARAYADALFDQAARRFVRLRGTSVGNPSLRVGTHVRVSGLSPRFDNVYYVVASHHRFDMQRGYETDFEAECAYLGGS